jgi:hypothetical protein
LAIVASVPSAQRFHYTVDAITRKSEDNFDTQFKRVSTMIPAAVSAISFSLRMV